MKHKPPSTAEAVKAANAKLCFWPMNAPQQHRFECVAFPSYRDSDEPAGWIIYRLDGQPFPEVPNGLKERKTHLLKGSIDGWVLLGGKSAVNSAQTIIKVEGIPDALAIYSRLPAGYSVVTNTSGAKSAKNCPIDIFTGKRVIVIGDNDEPGVKGANSLAGEIVPYASEVKVIFPDGEITESGGKDIRDVMNENQLTGTDHQATVDALIQKVGNAPPLEIQPDVSEQKEDRNDTNQFDEPEEYQPFPVEHFPSVLRNYVTAGAKSLRCDPAFIALPLLVVVASLVGASRVLRTTKNWKVPAILWGVVIAESGSMKSPAMKLATGPIYKLQAKAHARNKEVREAYALRKAVYDTRMKEYIKELAKADGPPPDEPEKPDEPRIIDKIVGDVTLERLAYIIKNNPKGIPIIRDELSGVIGNLNKYSGSKGSDESTILECYSLGTMQVHRKHDPCDMLVPNAATSIGGNTQPKTYQRMMDSNYRESGLMSRFLKVYPPRTVKKFPGEGISDEIEEALVTLIESLDELQPMETEAGEYEPVSIYLTPEAHQAYEKFFQWHNAEAFTKTGDLSAEWSKLEEIPLRLSLIFHCIECVTRSQKTERVSSKTMHNAIHIAEWFKNESLRVYRLFDSEEGIKETPQQQLQKRLIRFIRGKGGKVSIRKVQQGIKSITTANESEAALNDLVRDGVGEWVNTPTKNQGRPTRVFQLFTRSTGLRSTNQTESSDLLESVDRSTEDDDSQQNPESESMPEQTEDTAPVNLAEFMDSLDKG